MIGYVPEKQSQLRLNVLAVIAGQPCTRLAHAYQYPAQSRQPPLLLKNIAKQLRRCMVEHRILQIINAVINIINRHKIRIHDRIQDQVQQLCRPLIYSCLACQVQHHVRRVSRIPHGDEKIPPHKHAELRPAHFAFRRLVHILRQHKKIVRHLLGFGALALTAAILDMQRMQSILRG